jgi:hypothetical protein
MGIERKNVNPFRDFWGLDENTFFFHSILSFQISPKFCKRKSKGICSHFLDPKFNSFDGSFAACEIMLALWTTHRRQMMACYARP